MLGLKSIHDSIRGPWGALYIAILTTVIDVKLNWVNANMDFFYIYPLYGVIVIVAPLSKYISPPIQVYWTTLFTLHSTSPEAHLEHKANVISFDRQIQFRYQNVSKYFTEHGNDNTMLSVKFQNDLENENKLWSYEISRDFNLRWIKTRMFSMLHTTNNNNMVCHTNDVYIQMNIY